jgi:hypothetical protein
MVLLAKASISKGSAKVTTHIWIFESTKSYAKDANQRDIWLHEHPDKTWADHEHAEFIGLSIFYGIVFLVGMVILAGFILDLPIGKSAVVYFYVFGGPVLGGATAAGVYRLQLLARKKMYRSFRVINFVSLMGMVIFLAGMLVLTFMKITAPISHHWVWVMLALPYIGILIEELIHRRRKTQIEKETYTLEYWAKWVVRSRWLVSFHWDAYRVEEALKEIDDKLRSGVYDIELKNKAFFKRTEHLMLDLVRGNILSINDPKLNQIKQEITRLLQTFYFTAVVKFQKGKVHPMIKKYGKKEGEASLKLK